MSLCFSQPPRSPGFPLAALDSGAQFCLAALSPLILTSGLGFISGPPQALPPPFAALPLAGITHLSGFSYQLRLMTTNLVSTPELLPGLGATFRYILVISVQYIPGNPQPDAPKLNSLSSLKVTPPLLSPLLVRGNFQLFKPETRGPIFVSLLLY